MIVQYRTSFDRDLKKIKDIELRDRIQAVIAEAKSASSIQHVVGSKKIRDAPNHYRIRIDDHRIGVIARGGMIRFVRVLPREDFYKFFP